MNEKQHEIAIKGFIYNLCVITGCKMPDDPMYIKALQYQIKECLAENEKFAKCTFEEILTAARFNAAGSFDERVQHWQANFNIGFLSEIILKWIDYKRDAENEIDQELMRVNVYEKDTRQVYDDDQALHLAIQNWNRTKDYMYVESRVFYFLQHRGDISLSDEQKDRIKLQAKTKTERIFRFYHAIVQQISMDDLTNVIARKIAVAEFITGQEVPDVNYTIQRKPAARNYDFL